MNTNAATPARWRRKPKPTRKSNCRSRKPVLSFSPTAWAKLLWLRDAGPTEVGGFGLATSRDPLLVDDVRLVRQTATSVTVQFDDDSVADLFDELVDDGLQPSQFGRVWIHTHPGDSAEPSQVDEETFDRCFSGTDWAVMFILARGGETYARLRFHVGPGGSLRIPTQVDWPAPFGASDHAGWDQEYTQCVHEPNPASAFAMSDLNNAADWTRMSDPFTDYQPHLDQEIFRNDGLEP
jgi:proteasome lid subunit RPN8/RPN11